MRKKEEKQKVYELSIIKWINKPVTQFQTETVSAKTYIFKFSSQILIQCNNLSFHVDFSAYGITKQETAVRIFADEGNMYISPVKCNDLFVQSSQFIRLITTYYCC